MNSIFKLLLSAIGGLWLGANPSDDVRIGWRTDGTGNYAEATPPTAWSKESNVLWKVKLPGGSQGSPIVVGDRVFVVSDPAELFCINAVDGQILWQRPCGLADFFGNEKAMAMAAEHKRLRGEIDRLNREVTAAKEDDARKKLIQPELDAAHKELSKTPAPAESASSESTNSAPTPVSDGTNVYALFGNGIISGFTVDGERLWIKHLETPDSGWGHCSSPALSDGQLFVHLNNFYALRAETGEIAWMAPLSSGHASPTITQFNGANVILSPAGAVVRCSDGKVLLKVDALSTSDSTPVLHEGVVYKMADGKSLAVRLTGTGADAVKAEKLWETKVSAGGRTPSPVLHKGLLYGVSTDGILDVVDGSSGKSVHKKRLNLGNVYSSAVAAGDYVYISGTKGTTVVLDPSQEFREVARNELEGFGSNPVFQDSRMFVRTKGHLYCIGKPTAATASK